MGVDVYLYAVGKVSDAELAAANEYARSRDVFGYSGGPPFTDDAAPFVRETYFPDRITWRTLHRYYGEGYERGPWPVIHNAVVVMRAAFPGLPVYYGGDTRDEGSPATDERLAELWAHWLGPRGTDYYDSR